MMCSQPTGRNRGGIETCIRRAVDAGELVSTTNIRGLANLFHTFLMELHLKRGTVLMAAISTKL